jgi:hypothetical protein
LLADKPTCSRGRQSAGTRVEIPKNQKTIARREPMSGRLKAHHVTLFGLSPTQAKAATQTPSLRARKLLLQLATGRRLCQLAEVMWPSANLPQSQIRQIVVAPMSENSCSTAAR